MCTTSSPFRRGEESSLATSGKRGQGGTSSVQSTSWIKDLPPGMRAPVRRSGSRPASTRSGRIPSSIRLRYPATRRARWPTYQDARAYRCPRCSTCRKSLRPGESDRAVATASTPSGGASTTSFIYNALGERVQLVAPTYTYNYPFDAFGQEIGIHNSSSGWGHYTADIAGRRIFLSGSATRWLFHPNVVGSSTMVTDQTGAVVQDATYYPWGQLWQSQGSFGGNWNFAAFGVLEPTTNLYH